MVRESTSTINKLEEEGLLTVAPRGLGDDDGSLQILEAYLSCVTLEGETAEREKLQANKQVWLSILPIQGLNGQTESNQTSCPGVGELLTYK